MPVIVGLVELRANHSEGLHEAHRREGLALEVEVSEKLLGSKAEQLGRVSLGASEAPLVGLQRVLELVDSLEALDCSVHIAGVAKVLETCREGLPGLLVEDARTLLGSHVFNKLNHSIWLLQFVTNGSTHHEELSPIYKS